MSQSPTNKKHFKEALIGISDGIVITLALLTGASVLTSVNNLVIAGLIIIIFGSLILGIAGFLAAKSRQQSLALQSAEEEERLKKTELDKTIRLFKKIGLGDDMQQQVATEIEKDSIEWHEYLQKYAQQLEKPDSRQLPKTALSIAISFAIGGLIPLAPYFFNTTKTIQLTSSVVLSTVALAFFGYLKSKVNNEPKVWGALRLVLLGLFAAAGTYGVAHIFIR